MCLLCNIQVAQISFYVIKERFFDTRIHEIVFFYALQETCHLANLRVFFYV